MPQIIGVGCDLLARSRLAGLSLDDPFFSACFTAREQAQITARSDPMAHYASHFAGKEAVMKALHADPNRLRWREIEILNDAQGAPAVTLSGSAQEAAAQWGVAEVQLSLSWERDYALAFAVAVG